MGFVLSIDTSGAKTSVSLSDGATILAESHSTSVESHNEELASRVSEILSDCGISPGSLTAILLGIGPGSFTGLRIGAAFASGTSAALHLPVYSVSSFLAKAYQYSLDHSVQVCAVSSDARRDELYFAIFRFPDKTEVVSPCIVSRSEAERLFALHAEEKSHWIDYEADCVRGMAALFHDVPGLFTRWEAEKIGSLEIGYIRPPSARTIAERQGGG